MSRPQPGSNYTIVSGDSLSSIAERAYGDPQQWPIIYNANQTILKSTDPNIVFPGETVFIPEQPELKQLRDDLIGSSNKDNELTIEINGRIIQVQSASIIRTMDTAADVWSAVIAWTPGVDEFIDKVTAPYSYAPAKARIGKDRLVTGSLFESNPTLDTNGSVKNLVGYSATINIVDSNLRPDNYEDNNVSLKERAEKLLAPYGLRVFVDAGVTTVNEKFDRVTANPQDTIFSHLAKLAAQKKVLISSTPKGNLFLTNANILGQPVGTIEETSPSASLSYTAKFDGRKRFQSWRITCQTPDKEDKKTGISKDLNVPIARFKNLNAANTTAGGIQETADWVRSKEFIKALEIPFPVPTWYAPNGKLWRENTTVIVKSKTIGVPNGFKFLIRQVKYEYSNSGQTAVLSLVPPQVYTGETIEEPWRL